MVEAHRLVGSTQGEGDDVRVHHPPSNEPTLYRTWGRHSKPAVAQCSCRPEEHKMMATILNTFRDSPRESRPYAPEYLRRWRICGTHCRCRHEQYIVPHPRTCQVPVQCTAGATCHVRNALRRDYRYFCYLDAGLRQAPV